MSRIAQTQANFALLAEQLFAQLQTGEELSLQLSAEDQTYVRFNNSQVRQATAVWQQHLTLILQYNGRKATFTVDLSHDVQQDLLTLQSLLQRARVEAQVLPQDPYLVAMQAQGHSSYQHAGQLPEIEDIIQTIATHTVGTGFTGLYAAGPQIRAVRNSAGLAHWFASSSYFLDYSLFTRTSAGAAKAVKSVYARVDWQREHFLAELETQTAQLAPLQQPARKLQPGNYRVYLAPAAVAELLGMFSWGAVSYSAWKNGQCALQKLLSGAEQFSEQFTLRENFSLALTPRFNSLGELPPEILPVISAGAVANLLISSRSAQEFGVAGNAADPAGWYGEQLRAPEILPGTLPSSEVLQALDTGIYISNLHYLNWSDVQNARITGMTRYACFWVEHGRIVAPIEDLRFDDSLFRLFGSELLALTAESVVHPAVDTYDCRALGGAKNPGVLLRTMRFTL